MSAADYHADPCPAPALSQSCVKTLLDRSPWHAWHNHPRLNPLFERDEPTKFDVGNVAHKLMLGRGKEIASLPFDDWRTKDAKAAREDAIGSGHIACLEHQFDRATDMVVAARAQLKDRGLGSLFDMDGDAELVMCWDEGGTWFKQMLDWRSSASGIIADYKTTELSIAPQNLGKMMVNAGWHIQAGMAARGLDVLDPPTEGLRQYLFVVQEAFEPYVLCVVGISGGPMTVARKSIDMAVTIWRHCIATQTWPGYPEEILEPELPGWFEQSLLDREIAHAGKARVSGDFEDLTMAG
jgi:hypothetical protein